MEQSTVSTPERMELEEAKGIVGVSQVPVDLRVASIEYGHKVWAALENQEYWPNKNRLAEAYRRLCQAVCEVQIAENGRFNPGTDFSVLNDQEIFHGKHGVEACPACSGLGERMKFAKLPTEVQCLKCKDVHYILDGEEITIHENEITVNGVDKSNDPKYKWLLGRVVEDCLSCKGSGRYIREEAKDLRVNVQCKTCKGRKYTPGSEFTQVLTKCKTCKGKRKLKIPKLAPEVKSTTKCKVCSGIGFGKPKPLPDNPVLSVELANSLAGAIKTM